MLRVAAPPIIAGVANELSAGNWPHKMLVTEPMHLYRVLYTLVGNLNVQIPGAGSIRGVTSPAAIIQLTNASEEFLCNLLKQGRPCFYGTTPFRVAA